MKNLSLYQQIILLTLAFFVLVIVGICSFSWFVNKRLSSDESSLVTSVVISGEMPYTNKNDIEQRKLPHQTTGLVITTIGKNSPVDYLNVGDVIVEAQKKKIKSIKDLEDIVGTVLKSNQKPILIVIYNNQNQRRYIGVKLD